MGSSSDPQRKETKVSNRHGPAEPRVCVECALEGRPEPEGPVPTDEEANPPIVSVDIASQNPKTGEIHQEYGVDLCGEHLGEAVRLEAERGGLVSVKVRARLTH